MARASPGSRFLRFSSSMTSTPPTHFKRDILRQTTELATTLNLLLGTGRPSLAEAAELVRNSRYVFLTGIGASWSAALGASALYAQRGFPVYTIEAAELLYGATIPPDS